MVPANDTLNTLLNEHDVARVTGLSIASVRRWRLLRRGPKYLKIGAAVRYKPKDISAWLECRRIRRHRKLPRNPIWTQLALAVLKVAVHWILRAN
jgi:predicted DNA-binding transcriptional regulator AlpA